jgi:tetratricopeptide (TPR) repeat protein
LTSFSLALLSRENSLIFPFLLILYHYSFKEKGRFKLKAFLPVAALSLIYIALRSTLLKSLLSTTFSTTFGQRVPGFFVALLNYVRLLIAPFPLHMEYGDRVFSYTDPRAIAGAIIFFVLLAYAFSVRKKEGRGIIFFAVLWFILALLPSSNFYPLNAYMAEHWLYIPSIGFVLIIAKGLVFLYENNRFRALGIGLAVLLIGFYATLTIRQNVHWTDAMSLYRLVLTHATDSARIHFNLGNQYYNQGKIAEAVPLYEKAIELDPEYSDAYTNLGLLHYESGRIREAVALYEKAVQITPKHSMAHTNLGVAYYDLGRRAEALSSYKKAIELNPDNAEAYNNWGIVEYHLGNDGAAAELYQKAIEADPAYAKAYSNLAIVYWRKKQYNLAIEYCDKAKGLGFVNPDLLKALKPYR